ncbi:MAG: hypothetical protein KF732_00105 [Flavobacteriales bacterium]|nr:hypothetical protein [Flavobacteriales bacterium]MBV6483593.1 hypothetical protein [Flavobacteriales bacterium]MBX2958333.1 hypothetical protein [Flavobacteriales bacterium]MCL4856379.1 hypothetical protein [Flavobacteriales bacterium]HRN41773.1 hypothetical protein [Vicingus sp.]
MKLRLFYTILFTFVFGYTKAQENNPPIIQEDQYVLPFDSLKAKDKMHFNFSTGVGIGFSGSKSNSISTYYSPNVSYEVSPTLDVSAGMTYVNSDVSNFRTLHDFGYRPFTGNISQYYTYVAARYQLNERLKIGGSVFYNLTDFNSSAFNANQPKTSFDKIGYSAFFEYKIGENAYLQGEIRVNDNNRGGFGMDPFGTSMGMGRFNQNNNFGSPFGR